MVRNGASSPSAQDYKGKRLVAVDSPGDDVEPETSDEEDNQAKGKAEQKPRLVGEQQTELAAFVKVRTRA